MSNSEVNVGDYVVYSTKGICRVEKMEEKVFDRDRRMYFVFSPIFDKRSTYFIPVDYDTNRVHIKPSLTESQAFEFIDFIKNAEPAQWIVNPNQRRQEYDKIYKNGTRKEKIGIMKAILRHKNEQLKIGKQLYASDEKLLSGCSRLIFDELAFVLGKTPEEIKESLNF